MKPMELAKVKNGDITYILKRYFEPQNFICSHCKVPHSEQSVGSDTYDRQHMDKYILQKTLDGTIKWDVLLDSHNLQNINKKYECSFDQMQWSFSVVGFKKNYNEWHYHYELQWTNEYGEHGKLKKYLM